MIKRLSYGLLLAVAALGPSAPAAAAPAWREAEPIATSPELAGPFVAGGHGRAAVLWSDVSGDACDWKEYTDKTGCRRIFASELRGGRFGRPSPLSLDGREVSWQPPLRTVLPNRELIVAWLAYGPDRERAFNGLEATIVQPDGTRAGPVLISERGDSVTDLALAANASGRTVLAWSQRDLQTRRQQIWASYRSPGGTFEPAIQLRESANEESFDIALNHRGEALVVWSEWERVVARVLAPDGRAGPVEVLTAASSQSDGFSNVVAGWTEDAGRVAAWEHLFPSSGCDLYCHSNPHLEATYAPRDGAFARPVALGEDRRDHSGLTFLPDSGRARSLSWTESCECVHSTEDGPPPLARLATLRPGSGFDPDLALRRHPYGISSPADGELLLLFPQLIDRDGPVQLMAASRPEGPGAELVAPIGRPEPGLYYASGAPIGGGDAIAAWVGTERDASPPSDRRLLAAIGRDDDEAPGFRRVRVTPRRLPYRGRKRLAVRVTASEPVRVIMSVARRNQDLFVRRRDDPARDVRLAFAGRQTRRLARGRYVVRIVVTDRAGNEAVRKTTIRVVRATQSLR